MKKLAKLFNKAIRSSERLFVTVTVMLKVEWVLRSVYHFDRQQVTAALNALLDVTELEFQTELALEQALWLFKRTGSRDFADCLHIALVSQAGQGPLLTLDGRASRIEGAQSLG